VGGIEGVIDLFCGLDDGWFHMVEGLGEGSEAM